MTEEKKKYDNPPLWVEIIGITIASILVVFIMMYTDAQYSVHYPAAGLKNAQTVNTNINGG